MSAAADQLELDVRQALISCPSTGEATTPGCTHTHETGEYAAQVMTVFRRHLPTLLGEMEKAGRVRRQMGTLLDNPFTSLTGRQMAKQILGILDGPA